MQLGEFAAGDSCDGCFRCALCRLCIVSRAGLPLPGCLRMRTERTNKHRQQLRRVFHCFWLSSFELKKWRIRPDNRRYLVTGYDDVLGGGTITRNRCNVKSAGVGNLFAHAISVTIITCDSVGKPAHPTASRFALQKPLWYCLAGRPQYGCGRRAGLFSALLDCLHQIGARLLFKTLAKQGEKVGRVRSVAQHAVWQTWRRGWRQPWVQCASLDCTLRDTPHSLGFSRIVG